MINNYVFSSESVGEGHPDKVADYISDTILDACLEQDKFSRVACETMVKSNHVVIAGEITTKAKLDYEKLVRKAINDIGYLNDDDVFHAEKIFLTNLLTKQSPDIAQGVDARKAKGKKTSEQGAGDQGIMFGYATNETPEFMPAAIMFAHRILTELAKQRKSGKGPKWLRPDCKSQVAVAYENGKPAYIENVVVSTQHAANVDHATIEKYIVEKVIKKVLPKKLITKKTQFLVNPTGNFVVGGPKVDRSAAYAARYVAKNIVAAGLADKCEIQLAYAIGVAHPVSIHVETFGTGKVDEATIEKAVRKVFSFKPADIISQLKLLQPIYKKTTNYGHFTKADLPWEDTSKAAELRKAVGLK